MFKNTYHCIVLSLKDSRNEIQSYEKPYNHGKGLQKESTLIFSRFVKLTSDLEQCKYE